MSPRSPSTDLVHAAPHLETEAGGIRGHCAQISQACLWDVGRLHGPTKPHEIHEMCIALDRSPAGDAMVLSIPRAKQLSGWNSPIPCISLAIGRAFRVDGWPLRRLYARWHHWKCPQDAMRVRSTMDI